MLPMEIPIFPNFCAPPCRIRTAAVLLPQLASNQDLALHLHLYLQKSRMPSSINGRGGPLGLNLAVSCSKIDNNNDIWRDSQCVEVIGIGSRVDPILDFCLSLRSPLRSPRFWSVIPGVSLKGQLQVRRKEKDGDPDILAAPQELQSHFKAVVLVASAGYGEEHITATDILRTVQSACGFVVAIVLNPFSFEGLRRRDEVRILREKLQDSVNFFVEIDIDALLKTDAVTLDEALRTTKRAIFFALDAISILISGFHPKHKYSPHGIVKELTVNELVHVLRGFSKGSVGFGFGTSLEGSVMQAVYDCPFFSMGLKEPNGIIICVFSGAEIVDFDDVHHFVNTFRIVTGCAQEMIICRVPDPDLELNTVATTVIALGCVEKTPKQKGSVLSSLIERVPFLQGFLRSQHSQLDIPQKYCSTDISSLHDGYEDSDDRVSDIKFAEAATDGFEIQCSELQMFPADACQYNYPARNCDDDNVCGYGHEHDASATANILTLYTSKTEACPVSPSNRLNFGVEDIISQSCIDKGDIMCEDGAASDNPCTYDLPVGVRTPDPMGSNITNSGKGFHLKLKDDTGAEVLDKADLFSRNRLADKFASHLSYKAITSSRGKNADASKKLGVLSVRAASMLEAERDFTSRLSPMMEIGYRGGIYKGHCQGGLPEGRGRLTFPDGSSYDGMWRYGKRSGLGRFHFLNGDIFQGSWRDDLMHGKGWFYFRNGDRWFANFWKGKASGEGRFYSKHGDVFFGHFQDGWRHGRFLCVKKNGTRYVEMWREGVLGSSEPLEPDDAGLM